MFQVIQDWCFANFGFELKFQYSFIELTHTNQCLFSPPWQSNHCRRDCRWGAVTLVLLDDVQGFQNRLGRDITFWSKATIRRLAFVQRVWGCLNCSFRSLVVGWSLSCRNKTDFGAAYISFIFQDSSVSKVASLRAKRSGFESRQR